MRGDNNTACIAANTGVAYSPAMRFSLRIFMQACETSNVRCWLLQLGTKENRIANLANQREINKATEAIRAAGWEPQQMELSNMLGQWEPQLQNAAKLFQNFDL